MCQRCFTGQYGAENADCNGDDEIGANDAIVLMQFLAYYHITAEYGISI
ncbi:MAG: hypothetical protein ACLUOF_07945 [Ruminococcus sp.]